MFYKIKIIKIALYYIFFALYYIKMALFSTNQNAVILSYYYKPYNLHVFLRIAPT